MKRVSSPSGPAAGFLLLLLLSPGRLGAAPPFRPGRDPVLLADPFLLGGLAGRASLRLHHPVPREVVLVTDRPWEGNTCGYFTIFRDGPLFRMYYRGSRAGGKRPKGMRQVTCYAESRDGIHWKRPDLGLYSWQGSRKNNILWIGPGAHDFTPFKDGNPRCPPEARYKACARGKWKGKPALFAFRSPDGIHWFHLGKGPILTQGAFDSQNQAFWDPVIRKYRVYFRVFRDGFRDIDTALSEDFLHWSRPRGLSYPGVPREHLYTNQIRPYFRSPRLYLGFPTRYLPARGSLTEGLFMAGRDGYVFHRWEEAFLRPGLNPEKWGNRCNYIWLGLVETPSSLPGGAPEISLYANEGYYRGRSQRIRRYTIRLDGFVSLHAPMSGGGAVTLPMMVPGGRLVLNASTSAAGGIRVELRDGKGRPLPGFTFRDCPEVFGDSLELPVRWRGKAGGRIPAGRSLILAFRLRDADLYSFRFQGEAGR